ncbi:MAG TPA: helix-turn-helix domain-containing protein [Chloroflexia bacterium]|nr:helix-turn-helix domain-containing protein [Chloroflexia bacterium]
MTYKYGQYCPVARATEILGDRWTLLIVRDMVVSHIEHFSELERGLPGIPRALLADRLRRLERAGVIKRHVEADQRKTSYRLTEAGWQLRPVIESLLLWGAKWAFGEPQMEELNPTLLMWWMRDRVYTERLPQERVVVEFDFWGDYERTGSSSYWLILKPSDVSVCLTHPGFDSDMLVKADLAAFYQVWLGRISFEYARRNRQIEIEAVPDLIRSFPGWFAWSPAAEGVRAMAGD